MNDHRISLTLVIMFLTAVASASAVTVYPVDPNASQGAPYRLMVGATEVPLERLGDGVFYGRCTGLDTAEVRVLPDGEGKIEAEIHPARLAADVKAGEEAVTFTASEAGPRVIQIKRGGRDLPRLLLIVDPPESQMPDPAKTTVIRVEDHGVVLNSDEVQTKALQAALDACAAKPGTGYVVVPDGRFITGTLRIPSDTYLYLSAGATLMASDDPADFPVDAGRKERGNHGPSHSFSRVIFFDNVQNAGLIGRGTVDGNGVVLRNRKNRPVQVIDAHDCEDIVIDGVVLKNSASWTCHLVHSTGVKMRDVKILADWSVRNTDGIDPDMCDDVLIERAFIYTGDDSIAVKATGISGFNRACSNIIIRDSVMMTRKTALKIGTETYADIRDVLFENIDVIQSSRGIACWVHDGGQVENITFENIRMSLVEIEGETMSGMPFCIVLEERNGKGSNVRNIVIKDIVCEAPYKSVLDNKSPNAMEKITFQNIDMKVTQRSMKPEKAWLFEINNTEDLVLRNMTVDWSLANGDAWLGLWPAEAVAQAGEIVQKGSPPAE